MIIAESAALISAYHSGSIMQSIRGNTNRSLFFFASNKNMHTKGPDFETKELNLGGSTVSTAVKEVSFYSVAYAVDGCIRFLACFPIR